MITGKIQIPKRLQNMPIRLRHNLKRALPLGASILEEDIIDKLSGLSHVKSPGNSNPYPGVGDSGKLHSTVTSELIHSGLGIKVGPNVHYAIYHEKGTKHMQARPFMAPAWKDTKKDVMQEITKGLLR